MNTQFMVINFFSKDTCEFIRKINAYKIIHLQYFIPGIHFTKVYELIIQILQE